MSQLAPLPVPPALSGSIVALVTPFCPDQTVDYHALDRLLQYHKDAGTSAVVMVGTTGESATLSVQEHHQVIAHAARKNCIPIIAGCGANATAEAVELTKRACQENIIATLHVTPYYNKPSQEGLYQHFSAVAAVSTVPVILYNVPARTAVDLLPETTARLSELPQVVAIKEAVPGATRVRQLRALVPDHFAILSGDDGSFLDCLANGGNGTISVTANVVPKLMQDICQLALSNQHQAAQELNQTIAPLHQALFVQSNPIPVKWALTQIGLINNILRLPLTPLAEAHHTTVAKALPSPRL